MKHKNDEALAIPYLVEITPSRLEQVRKWWDNHWLEIILISSFVVIMLFITLIIIYAPTPVEVYEYAYKDCIATERHTAQECHEIALFDVADD